MRYALRICIVKGSHISAISLFLILTFIIQNANAKQETLEGSILIGLIPEQNIFKQVDRYKPLAAYLSEKTGINVRLTILSRYGDVVERFVSRGMDGAFFDSFTGALAITRLGVEPIARPVNLDGTATVRSYILVRTDSRINSTNDMKGKKMVFVDKASATGYLFAIAFMREKGIFDIGEYFSEYYFAGSHDSVIYSVLDNRADIGIAQNTAFERLASHDPTIKKELKVFAESGELPGTTLCLKKNLPIEIKKRIKDALIGMNNDPKGIKVLKEFGALRFIDSEVKDFRPILSLTRRAGIDIRSYNLGR